MDGALDDVDHLRPRGDFGKGTDPRLDALESHWISSSITGSDTRVYGNGLRKTHVSRRLAVLQESMKPEKRRR
jgi:hypothetical protein